MRDIMGGLMIIAMGLASMWLTHWAWLFLIAIIVVIVAERLQERSPYIQIHTNPFLWLTVACFAIGVLPIVAIRFKIAPPSVWLALTVAFLAFFAAGVFAAIGGMLEYEDRKAKDSNNESHLARWG